MKDRAICYCIHGSKCTCALKKEAQLGSVTEIDSEGDPTGVRRVLHKPRLSATQSDASLMVFANHHHKPVHKHGHMVQKRGTPYRIPKRRATQGNADLTRRSVDHLSTSSSIETGLSTSPAKDSLTPIQQDVRLVRSEHGSPHLSVSPDLTHVRGTLPPLDLSFSNFHPSAGRPSYEVNGWATSPLDTYFCTTPESDQPIFSAGLEPPTVDWSAFDPPLGSGGFTSASHSQRPSYDGFDFGPSGPAYAASVGASDADDLTAFGVPSPLHPPSLVFNHISSDNSDTCETESYRLSSSSSMHGLPQLSLLASSDLEGMSSEDFMTGAAVAGTYGPSEPVGDVANSPFVPASFPVNEPSKLAPTSVPNKRYSLPLSTEPVPASLWGPPLDSLPIRHNSSPVSLCSENRGAQPVW